MFQININGIKYNYLYFNFSFIGIDMIAFQSRSNSQPNAQLSVLTNLRLYSSKLDPKEMKSQYQKSSEIKHARNNKIVNIFNFTVTANQKCQGRQKGCIERGIDCLLNIFDCNKKQKNGLFINVNSSNILDTLQNLKINQKEISKKCRQNDPLAKKTLVLELQGTLVFSTRKRPQKYDYQFSISQKNPNIKNYTIFRYGLNRFLEKMSKKFEIIIYTSSPQQFANPIIQKIDNSQYVSQTLFRDSCININNMSYLKTIRQIERSPRKIIFIDVTLRLSQSNIRAGILQPDNFLQIQPFKGDQDDRQLIKLMSFLQWVNNKDNLTPVCQILKEYMKYYNQIERNYNKEGTQQNLSKEKEEHIEKEIEIENKKYMGRVLQNNKYIEAQLIKCSQQMQKTVGKQKVQDKIEVNKQNINKQNKQNLCIQDEIKGKPMKQRDFNIQNKKIGGQRNKNQQIQNRQSNFHLEFPNKKAKTKKRQADFLHELSLQKRRPMFKRIKSRTNVSNTNKKHGRWGSEIGYLRTESTSSSVRQSPNMNTALNNKLILNTQF